jgi:hypothetical protein
MRGTAGIEFQTGGWTVGKKRGLRCGVPDRAVPGAAAALRSGRTLVMSFVGSVIRRKRKITTQKHIKNKTQLGRAGFFFSNFVMYRYMYW